MTLSHEEGGDRAEQIRHLIGSSPFATVGNERFALDLAWFQSTDQAPLTCSPEDAAQGVVWIPSSALERLEEWFGPLLLKRGIVVQVNNAGRVEEVEYEPTFARVEFRTAVDADPVSVLDNVSLCEEIPTLIRRALDAATQNLRGIDEEDVRMWVQRSSSQAYVLADCDFPKAITSSASTVSLESQVNPTDLESEDLPPPILRSALPGVSIPPKSTLYVLLELREDGKFPRQVGSNGELATAVAKPAADAKKSSVRTPPPSTSIVQQYSRKKQSFSSKDPVKVGQRCDALRAVDDRWLEAMVVEVTSGKSCKIHFLSFPSHMDEVFPLAPMISPNIQPPHTKVPDWRQQLKVGDIIDLHTSVIRARVGGSLYYNLRDRLKNTNTRWIPCNVRKIERHGDNPRLTIGVGLTNKYFGPEHLFQVPMDAETIAARYTHVIRPKSYNLGPQSTPGEPPCVGVVGLRNLGNTCYMNSVVQCLSHCDVLREHFVSGAFEQEINRRNPLGMGGQLAESFANLLQQMWSNEFQVVAPNRFKLTLGQMNSQFQGFQQHDSQELLTQLLDCLHEDLNRVLKKPVTTPVECENKTDLQIYEESWEKFKLRNDSKIVSEMYGMMKSHLLCPVCNKEAVTFDAYANVSVPIPSLALVHVNFVFLDSELKATRCAAMLPKRAPPRALAEWLCSQFPCLQEEDILIGEIVANKVGTFFHRTLSSGSVLEGDEVETKSTVRDLAASRSLFAWQVQDKQIRAPQEGDQRVYPEFEAKWSLFWSELDSMAGDAGMKDFVVQNFTPELGFPFPFAQDRLAKGLALNKNRKLTQTVAREVCRLVELEGQAAISALVRECGAPGSGVLNKQDSAEECSSSPPPLAPVRSKSVAPIRFFTRLFSISPSKDMRALPNSKVSSLKIPPCCDPNARLVVELNHFRAGKRNSRVPNFVSIQADRTWGELQEEITAYLNNVVLCGYVRGEEEGDEEELFSLELDSVERVPFPLPFVPLLESLNHKNVTVTVNSLSIVVRWKHAIDFVFGTEDSVSLQLEENPFKISDATLGLGQVRLHSSVVADTTPATSTADGAITLDQCLEAFRKREQLGKDDAWFCDKCKTHQRAFKTMDLWNTPNVLVIHLKRFLYERAMGERVQREKINDLVTFPLTNFDTRPLLAGGAAGGGLYDLFAVSNHMGGLGGGHYVAYVKANDGLWWHMNDNTVSKVEDASQVISSSAYVLFYKKKTA